MAAGDAKEAHEDRAALLDHLRASQTPPHAVTREQIEAVITAWVERRLTQRFDALLEDEYREGLAEAILALLAEKPAPTVTPLTPDDVWKLYAEAATTKSFAIAIIERLSASPTTPTPALLNPRLRFVLTNTAQENER